MIGRLQTERDKDRLLDGMDAAGGGVDIKELGNTISGLSKREFVLRRAGKDHAEVFTTRWAMSYLRGPLTKDQIRLVQPHTASTAADSGSGRAPEATSAATDAAVPGADGTTPVMPQVADGTPVRWLDAAASGLTELGGDPAGANRSAAVVAEVLVRYDDTKLALNHDVTLTLGSALGGDRLDASVLADVPVDLGDLLASAPGDERYHLPAAPIGDKAAWKQFERDLIDVVVRTRPLELLVSGELKLASLPGEPVEEFRARCATAAQRLIDADKAKLTADHERKASRLTDQRDAAADRVAVVEQQVEERKRGNWLRAAGDMVGGLLGSGRSAAGRIGRAAERLTRSSGSDSQRVDEAQNRVERIEQQQADLDAKLADALRDVEAKWATVAQAITTTNVSAEKTDTKVSQLYLVWVPTT
jgi:hypothetical protein